MLTAGQTVTGIDFGNRPQYTDFGDAPSPYPTLAADGGAWHAVVPDMPTLGESSYSWANVDTEVDGQPDAYACGDDSNQPFGIDDERGVDWSQSGPLLRGWQSSIVVYASSAGYLDAWIDFDGDGNWSDAEDQIVASKALIAGRNELKITVPATAKAGQTFARFRISSQGGLSPTGFAADGEVEDYAVTIEERWTMAMRQFPIPR